MKPSIKFLILAAALTCGFAKGQTTAYTTPVGYVSLGNTTAPAVPAETDFFISIPLERATEAVATIDSVTSDTITLSASSNLGAFYGGVPYLVKITSGAKEGLVALITANSAASITVQLGSGDSLSGIVAGDKVAIQKAWTPKAISSLNTIPTGTQILAFSGTAPGVNVVNDITYEFDGSSWLDLSTFASADDSVLYPGEGIVIRTVSGSPIQSLVLSGQVPTTNSRVVIANMDAGGQDNVISHVSPVSETLNVSNLGFNVGDQIILFEDPETNGVNVSPGQNKSAAITLEYQGAGAWLNLATFVNVEGTFKLPAGESFVYRVAPGAPSNDVVWSDEPAYVPSL